MPGISTLKPKGKNSLNNKIIIRIMNEVGVIISILQYIFIKHSGSFVFIMKYTPFFLN